MKTTSGEGEKERRGRIAAAVTLIGAATALAVILAFAGTAAAASPAPGPAELVFANGGRIVSVKADGTGRQVLTRTRAPVASGNSWDSPVAVEDDNPSVSPDGNSLLFERDRNSKQSSKATSSLVVANRDGTGQQSIASFENPIINYLGWMPDGRVIVGLLNYSFSGGKEKSVSRVISMNRRGGDRKTLLSKVLTEFPNGNGSHYLNAQDVSSDGKLLYVVDRTPQSVLRTLDLETGTDRKILSGADQAAFSPDAGQIVFTVGPCHDGRGQECEGRKPGLWISGVEGDGQRRLLGGKGYPSGAKWSPDGRTITFDSARNFPSGGDDAREIYSIGAGGGCLAWLTNGSPESVSASWDPEASKSRPAACGGNGLKPLVEVRPDGSKNGTSPRLWAGPRIQDRLLSSATSYGDSESFEYKDCGFFRSARCHESLALDSIPTCNPGNLASGVSVGANRMVPSYTRGALLNTVRTRRGSVSALLLTGQAQIYIGDSSFLPRGGRANRLADLSLITGLLRPVGSSAGFRADLPAPVLPGGASRAIERIYRVYHWTGSIKETAALTSARRSEVKWFIKYESVISHVRPFKSAKCSR
jgi:Tol biopolymer transport system component